ATQRSGRPPASCPCDRAAVRVTRRASRCDGWDVNDRRTGAGHPGPGPVGPKTPEEIALNLAPVGLWTFHLDLLPVERAQEVVAELEGLGYGALPLEQWRALAPVLGLS